MRLRLSLAAPPGDVELIASRLEPLPALGVREWAEERARAGGAVHVTSAREAESTQGWPVLLFEGEARGEQRCVAVYQCLGHGGSIELRAPRPLRADERQLLLEGVPDFSGQIACLADVLGDPRVS